MAKSGIGVGMIAVVLVLGIAAFYLYKRFKGDMGKTGGPGKYPIAAGPSVMAKYPTYPQ